VVVGDRKSPPEYKSRAVYLSPDDQERLPFATLAETPWNHFGRKNLGYLYAIQHGARMIYDVDDDNQLTVPISALAALHNVATRNDTHTIGHTDGVWHHLFNPYPEFAPPGEALMWPRGFPLDAIHDSRTYNLTTVRWMPRPKSHVGLVQLLADVDPDVDAIYRLSQGVPVSFTKRTGTTVVPRGVMSPCNGQALVALQSSFWALNLPITVHGEWPTPGPAAAPCASTPHPTARACHWCRCS
jgi:hypothetical protein